jgi:regulator of sigma E protease
LFSFIQMALVFALVLGAMVVIHEFGHFIVAKFFGIRVETFSVGFGKRLWGFRKGDTDYRLSLIPLGGYVKMAGENLDEQITGAPDEFMSKPKWQRLCVAVAGPVMNILTALAIPAVMAMVHFEAHAYLTKPAVVNAVVPGSPAQQAGIQRGDTIIKIEGDENPTWRDVEDIIIVNPEQSVPVTIKRGNETKDITLRVGTRMVEQEKLGESGLEPDLGPDVKIVARDITAGWPAEDAGLKAGDEIIAVNGNPIVPSFVGHSEIISAIQNSNGQPVALTVKRDGETLTLQTQPRFEDGRYRIGFVPMVADVEKVITRLSPGAAIQYSFDTTMRIIRLTKTALAQIFVGTRSARDTLTGPVGIFKLSGQAAEQGASSVFNLMAVLSLNLGIFNLLPIPVLDGGLIFMLLLEGLLGLFGLPLTLRIKERMMQVGFVMLMLLMGFVIFNDISKLIPSRGAPQQQVEQQPASNK